MQWRVFKARYPIDPNRAWIAAPGRSLVHARRFRTWAEAMRYVTAKTNKQKERR